MRASRLRISAERLRRVGKRARDVVPVTALGISVGLGAALGLRVFAYARLDLVWLVVAYALLGLLALDVLLVLLATLGLKLRLRVPEGVAETTQTETPSLTGFRPPRWAWVPLLRVQHELVAPVGAEVVSVVRAGERGFGAEREALAGAEWVRFTRRGEVRVIERRVRVADVLGLAELAFRSRQALVLRVLPNPGALARMPVLTSFAAGDDVAHPLGAADGDRVELRRYQPGDPARLIHWKIYARTGKLLVRQPERSLTQTTRTVAFLVAGPRDEPAAAAARVALEQGALGADWLFGAEGTPTPVSDLPAALDAILRSGDIPPSGAGGSSGDTPPSSLEPFLHAAELRGPARVVVFAPPTPGAWLPELLRLAATRAGRVHVVLGVDGVSRPAARSLALRLLRTPPVQRGDDLVALDQVRAALAAAGVDNVVVDRRSGQVLGDTHLRAALEAA